MNNMLNVSYEMDEKIMKAAQQYADGNENNVNLHYETLLSRKLPYTGWVNYAAGVTKEEISEIEAIAGEIRANSSVFVVIGIGGSYLGAKSALEFICQGGEAVGKKGSPKVVFAGFNLSGTYHKALIDSLKDEDVSICQISKSGGTVEPGMAFIALRKLLIEKYGKEEADKRTYAVTDAKNGVLRQEVIDNGYRSLVIPSDIGGRYSVLTPVGLLPMAVAGIDVRKVLEGAIAASGDEVIGMAKKLAATRRSIQDIGKVVEVLGCFEPSLGSFTEWIMQLYGESEGKEGKGMLPVGVGLSRDLHSLGQFFQEGTQMFFETLLNVQNPAADIVMGPDTGEKYANRSFGEFNRAVKEGMVRAHRLVDIPIIIIDVQGATAFDYGLLVYFFEMTCALTGLLMGVNPFDQPGVEQYKKEMMDFLAAK